MGTRTIDKKEGDCPICRFGLGDMGNDSQGEIPNNQINNNHYEDGNEDGYDSTEPNTSIESVDNANNEVDNNPSLNALQFQHAFEENINANQDVDHERLSRHIRSSVGLSLGTEVRAWCNACTKMFRK